MSGYFPGIKRVPVSGGTPSVYAGNEDSVEYLDGPLLNSTWYECVALAFDYGNTVLGVVDRSVNAVRFIVNGSVSTFGIYNDQGSVTNYFANGDSSTSKFSTPNDIIASTTTANVFYVADMGIYFSNQII